MNAKDIHRSHDDCMQFLVLSICGYIRWRPVVWSAAGMQFPVCIIVPELWPFATLALGICLVDTVSTFMISMR